MENQRDRDTEKCSIGTHRISDKRNYQLFKINGPMSYKLMMKINGTRIKSQSKSGII